MHGFVVILESVLTASIGILCGGASALMFVYQDLVAQDPGSLLDYIIGPAGAIVLLAIGLYVVVKRLVVVQRKYEEVLKERADKAEERAGKYEKMYNENK